MEPSTSAYLVAQDDKREIPLASGYMWKIGRDEHCDIVVPDNRISREHALIQRDDSGEYYLIDMGSRNGSFINERRISTPAQLRDGDSLSIGGCSFVFCRPSGDDSAEVGSLMGGAATEAWFVRQYLTVLVVDIRNFTPLTQQIEQSVLCETIGTWFRYAGEITKRHGHWSLKYIGDAIMAVWMHPEPRAQRRDALRILQALVELAGAASELESSFHLPVPIRIGAGINTGYAVVGNTGGRTFTDYTAMGDAVNMAFRFESATKEIGMDVVIGSSTLESLHTHPALDRCFQQQEVRLKGYKTPVAIWAASLDGVKAFLDELAQEESAPPA